MVRAFAHGAMGRRIDPTRWTHSAFSRSSQCPTTGVTKAVVCVILSVESLERVELVEIKVLQQIELYILCSADEYEVSYNENKHR